MSRPIDAALSQDRPAKRTVRRLWLDEVNQYTANEGPLYLTLPGAEGKDIELLIEAGIVSTTDTGAISAADIGKIVAVESNSEAVLSLQRKYPGLRIHDSPLENVMNGAGPFAWPPRNVQEDMRARVINIDLDKSLKAEFNGNVSFPLIRIIKKISQLHRERPNGDPPQPWSLCITINSTTNWPDAAINFFFRFLAENCESHPAFREGAIAALGNALVDRIMTDHTTLTLRALERDQQERLLCIFLPKLILSELNDHHWDAQRCYSLGYGGNGDQAAMTTVTLRLDVSNVAVPSQRYASNILRIFPGLGRIDDDGELALG